jgi:hypothetical protein
MRGDDCGDKHDVHRRAAIEDCGDIPLIMNYLRKRRKNELLANDPKARTSLTLLHGPYPLCSTFHVHGLQ